MNMFVCECHWVSTGHRTTGRRTCGAGSRRTRYVPNRVRHQNTGAGNRLPGARMPPAGIEPGTDRSEVRCPNRLNKAICNRLPGICSSGSRGGGLDFPRDLKTINPRVGKRSNRRKRPQKVENEVFQLCIGSSKAGATIMVPGVPQTQQNCGFFVLLINLGRSETNDRHTPDPTKALETMR